MASRDLRGRVEIVERRGERQCGQRLRDPRAARQPERRDPGSGAHEKRIRVSVVAPIELQDTLSPSGRSGEPQ